jgi:hypothetical protein
MASCITAVITLARGLACAGRSRYKASTIDFDCTAHTRAWCRDSSVLKIDLHFESIQDDVSFEFVVARLSWRLTSSAGTKTLSSRRRGLNDCMRETRRPKLSFAFSACHNHHDANESFTPRMYQIDSDEQRVKDSHASTLRCNGSRITRR